MENDPQQPVLIYITVPDRAQAEAIARTLVAERLLACANIIDGVTSIYRWQGQVCQDPELLLLGKTVAGRVAAIKDRLPAIHSYQCPCLTVLPITDALPAYLAWLREQVEP